MANILQKYFPMIRTREEVWQEISGKEKLLEIYRQWNREQQEEFLDFCTGNRGIKILYDAFFKEILKVLPNDTVRIADESSLVIMDIVIEMEDHSIANVEVQKIGYLFAGQRSACYSADLLLRQYKRVKGEKGKPGEVQGSIDNGKVIGEVYKNTNFGIYGKLTDVSLIEGGKTLEVMPRDEVKLGKATIICTLDNNKREEHEIEIERLYTSTNRNNKNMIIKVTDERLLEKTGGIIQGMSGSPILQDGKFVGAVTHVMVNNPEKGYGIFADTMLKQMKEVEKN